MQYVSTRGRAPQAGFEEALLRGLAPDGGLYLPAHWPEFTGDALHAASFADAAAGILALYAAPWLDPAALRIMATKAYSSFTHEDVAPLIRIGEEDWLLELFHGPTLAFKDVAMQLLGELFDYSLRRSDRRATIIGATSGDTGGAAIEAFRGRERVEIFILHPLGRVSDVQRRMMTTPQEENVHNIAVQGTFDDCQRIVKALMGDADFCARHSVSGVNSINWARLAIQTVYYFTALAALGRETGASPAFSVPTGNFGDVFAGYAAKRMGAGACKLCVAVNRNDILHRALTSGRYEPASAEPTTSPSMDIQLASNFERLLFEATDRDAGEVRALMRKLEDEGGYDIPSPALQRMREDFTSDRVSEAESRETIGLVYRQSGILIDPHTSIAVAAAAKLRAAGAVKGPVISLATAHPAKFPDAVEAASGVRPDLPEHMEGLFDLPERYTTIGADPAAVRAMIETTAAAN